MNHFATPGFWFHDRQLPDEIREMADKSFVLLREDPGHPSLRLKKIGSYWSARIGLQDHALGRVRSVGAVWFWIGPHNEYDRLLKNEQ